MPMFRAALFTATEQWNNPSVRRWAMGKHSVLHPHTGCDSASTRKGTLTAATARME